MEQLADVLVAGDEVAEILDIVEDDQGWFWISTVTLVDAWFITPSVTVRSYSTLVVAAEKTQKWLVRAQPSRTLISSSIIVSSTE